MSENRLLYLKSRRTILRNSGKLDRADELLYGAETIDVSEINVLIQELREGIKRQESLTEDVVERLVEPTEADIEEEAMKIEEDTVKINTIILRLTEKPRKNQAEINSASTDQQQTGTNSEIAQLRRGLKEMRANGAASSDNSRPGSVALRLPKLEVDKFDGDILLFKEFWDHFEKTNRHFRPVEKLNYRRAYLSGEAKQVNAGLTATDENHDVTLNQLRHRQRCADTQVSIDAHCSLQAVSNDTSVGFEKVTKAQQAADRLLFIRKNHENMS